MPTSAVDAVAADIDAFKDEIEEVLREEKEEKEIQNAEVQIARGQNLIKHKDEIKSRPRRTWFETQRDKEEREKASKAQLNGLELPKEKKGSGGKLSNKKRKRMEGREEMEEGGGGRVYKKTKADRVAKRGGGGKGKGKKGKAKGTAAKSLKGKGGKKFAQKMARGKGKTK